MSDLDSAGDGAGSPDFEVPEAFRLSDYADRSAWELGGADEDPLEALVHFCFPINCWPARSRPTH